MEIEVKALLKDTRSVQKRLEELGCVFSEPEKQDDVVFVQKTGSLENFLSNDVFLRIRVQNQSKIILTAKKPVRKSPEELVKYEYEVVVDSEPETRGILSLMGYQQAVRIVKERQTCTYGTYEICLDTIEGLGSFIEVEQMGEKEHATAIQSTMFQFLETLGISPQDQVRKGYDILMLEKESTGNHSSA